LEKIALLTFHNKNNFGAVLQTYATIRHLQKSNYNVTLIDLIRKPNNWLVSIIYERLVNYNFWRFRDEHFRHCITERIYTDDIDKLRLVSKEFDSFIIGSDQVWRKEFTRKFGYLFFLDFIENKNKISYASSFGLSVWNDDLARTQKIEELLKDFDAISVRESSGINICKDSFNVDALKVVDPTLLIPLEDYVELASKSKIKSQSNYIAKFLLDKYSPEQTTILSELFLRMGKKTKDLSIPRVSVKNVSLEMFPNSIEHWLKSLRDSDYIVTESFHCVIFALIFRKNFICILNDVRGTARIESILNQVDLSHLMIRLNSSVSVSDMEHKLRLNIDYDKVWSILDKEIRFSKNYLKEALIN